MNDDRAKVSLSRMYNGLLKSYHCLSSLTRMDYTRPSLFVDVMICQLDTHCPWSLFVDSRIPMTEKSDRVYQDGLERTLHDRRCSSSWTRLDSMRPSLFIDVSTCQLDTRCPLYSLFGS